MRKSVENTYLELGKRIVNLYGAQRGINTLNRVWLLIQQQKTGLRRYELSDQDVILIAYGDHVLSTDETPLLTLHRFLETYVQGVINTVHILPFYPYSSDDGFSIIDYRAVDSQLGTWDDIYRIRQDFRMMFDLVLNHISVSHHWFQEFLSGRPDYQDYFITVDPTTDLSMVTRPRTHPLLTPFKTRTGLKHVWTTFSEDQADLNFAEPNVLIEIIEVLLFYVAHGADLIRLDAIAYLWKSFGTSCIHLRQTHSIVKLLRNVLDIAAPWVKLITETNVPHDENVSYFGNGEDEAQLVYQFALPPLILHAFYTGRVDALSSWARSLPSTTQTATFFNFTASHDGIGVRPVTGLISDDDLTNMLNIVQQRGGQISYKSNTDGSQSAYEMNITYFDALTVPGEATLTSVDRFITSQAIMLSLAGVPGIYLPSLIGASNWYEGVEQTGRARTINRQKFNFETLTAELADPTSRAAQVIQRYSNLLHIRCSDPAFHPAAAQRTVSLHFSVFAVERISLDGQSSVLALHNVSDKTVQIVQQGMYWRDLLSGNTFHETVILEAFGTLWLQPIDRLTDASTRSAPQPD